jgi:hypothetical protein
MKVLTLTSYPVKADATNHRLKQFIVPPAEVIKWLMGKAEKRPLVLDLDDATLSYILPNSSVSSVPKKRVCLYLSTNVCSNLKATITEFFL